MSWVLRSYQLFLLTRLKVCCFRYPSLFCHSMDGSAAWRSGGPIFVSLISSDVSTHPHSSFAFIPLSQKVGKCPQSETKRPQWKMQREERDGSLLQNKSQTTSSAFSTGLNIYFLSFGGGVWTKSFNKKMENGAATVKHWFRDNYNQLPARLWMGD